MTQRSEKPIVLCIANQKGGVGKTTTAVNLVAGLARRGLRTLLVDLDIQGSATATLGAAPARGKDRRRVPHRGASARRRRARDLDARPLARTRRRDDGGRRHPPRDRDGARARPRTLPRLGRPASTSIDVIVIDTAPYLGLLTTNALVAADHVLVPVSCEYLPILGLKLFNDTLTRMRTRLGARAAVLGYLLTMVDRRESITRDVEELLRRTFGELVLPDVIRVEHEAQGEPVAPTRRSSSIEGSRRERDGRTTRRLTSEVMRRAKLDVARRSYGFGVTRRFASRRRRFRASRIFRLRLTLGFS